MSKTNPKQSSVNPDLEARMKTVLSEPEKKFDDFLKPDKVKVGDMVKVESVTIDPEHEIDTPRGPQVIAERPIVTGAFISKGQSTLGQTVKVSISKSSERGLYELWGANWVGKTMMVSKVESKNIEGRNTTWIVWVGLP